jgi:hypothetical protein
MPVIDNSENTIGPQTKTPPSGMRFPHGHSFDQPAAEMTAFEFQR